METMGFMIIFCEIIFLALIAGVIFAISKSTPKALLSGIILHFSSMLISVLFLQLSLFCTQVLFSNVFTQWVLSLALSIIVYILSWKKGRNILTKQDFSFPVLENHPRKIKTLLLTALAVFIITSGISITTVLSTDKEMSSILKNKSLYCHLFINDNDDLNVDQSSWQEFKTEVANHSGSRSLADNIRALNLILNLQAKEYDHLLAKNENLKKLLKEPALQDIINDQEVFGTLIKGELSLRQLYKLGANKKIKTLLNNNAFILLVRRINLIELEKNIYEYRQSRLSPLSVQWFKSSINNSLELDKCLTSGVWHECRSENIKFNNAPFNLLKATLSAQGLITIVCKASTAPIMIQNEISRKMKAHGDSYSIELDNPQNVQLTLMFQFPEESEPYCHVEVFNREL
jgi:hypothetical protein